MSEYSWDNSKCGNSWLHRFDIIEQYQDGVLEVCKICRKKKFFRAVAGRPDNNVYIAYHNRQLLPRNHPLYEREYPRHE